MARNDYTCPDLGRLLTPLKHVNELHNDPRKDHACQDHAAVQNAHDSSRKLCHLLVIMGTRWGLPAYILPEHQLPLARLPDKKEGAIPVTPSFSLFFCTVSSLRQGAELRQMPYRMRYKVWMHLGSGTLLLGCRNHPPLYICPWVWCRCV